MWQKAVRADIEGTTVSTRGGLEISKSEPGEVRDVEGRAGSSYEGLVGGQVGQDKEAPDSAEL